MGWLANMFSPASASARKGAALSSTHDAFALPTHSPGFAGAAVMRSDPFSPPAPESDAPGSYTYPPPSSSTRPSFDYVPSPTSARGRTNTSLLPLHNNPGYGGGGGGTGMGPQPPLAHTWARLRAWLAREYPELGDTLNYGLPAPELAALELQLGGLELPAAVRDSYLCADGQEPESAAACTAGLFFGLTLLPFEDVLEEWRFWREVDDDPQTGANPRLRTLMGSVPPGFVRREYSSRGWIPLAADKAGNYLGVDLAPDERGAAGQVIVFGRDVDTKVVLWRGDGPDGWARWLAGFADELEAGETFEFAGTRADGSDGEDEDDIGYGGYYYDGAGRGHGDSGGDGGAGGLQLVGEYRGWDVLQAWADRSIRRWQAAGAYPDTSVLTSGTSQLQEKVGLGVLELPADGPSTPSSSTSPADADTSVPAVELTPSSPSARPTHGARASVSRAPAPAPVVLPTELDLIPDGEADGEDDEYSPVRADDVEAAYPAPAPAPAPAHPLADLLGDAPVQQLAAAVPAIAVSEPEPIGIVGEHSEDDDDEGEDDDEDEDEDDDDEEEEEEEEHAPAPAAAVSTVSSPSDPSSAASSDIEGFETVDVPTAPAPAQ